MRGDQTTIYADFCVNLQLMVPCREKHTNLLALTKPLPSDSKHPFIIRGWNKTCKSRLSSSQGHVTPIQWPFNSNLLETPLQPSKKQLSCIIHFSQFMDVWDTTYDYSPVNSSHDWPEKALDQETVDDPVEWRPPSILGKLGISDYGLQHIRNSGIEKTYIRPVIFNVEPSFLW